MGEEKRIRKFWEGELLYRNARAKEFVPIWVVLKGRSLNFFRDRESSKRNHVDEIFLDITVSVKASKKEHVFELTQRLSKKDKQEHKFKCQSRTERELWRAFIIGVAQGAIPADTDWSCMLPGQQDDLLKFVRFLESGGLLNMGMTIDRQSTGSSGSGGSSISFEQNNNNRNIGLVPKLQLSRQSWYFEHIDREKGEQILGTNSGDLLVRPSVTRKGNFVIQYKATKKRGDFQFYNFLVENMATGFALVINDTDVPTPVLEAALTPKPTVFDVFNFFMLHVTRFLSTTNPRPLVTNDLNELGLWGEYGTNHSPVATLQRNDPASRVPPKPRRVHFDSSTSGEDTGEGDSDSNISDYIPPTPPIRTYTKQVLPKPPSPPQPILATFKRLPKKNIQICDDCDLPPAPLAPTPPPLPPTPTRDSIILQSLPLPPLPPATPKRESNSPLPPPPPPISSTLCGTNSDDEDQPASEFVNALKNVRLRSANTMKNDADTSSTPSNEGSHIGSGKPPTKAPAVNFQDELRKKLNKRLNKSN